MLQTRCSRSEPPAKGGFAHERREMADLFAITEQTRSRDLIRERDEDGVRRPSPGFAWPARWGRRDSRFQGLSVRKVRIGDFAGRGHVIEETHAHDE